MLDSNQGDLSNSLAQSYANLQDTIKGRDLDIVVYGESSWQIRDILWHIAVWDQQVTKSVLAFNNGSEYSIPGFDEDRFNQEAYLEGKKLSDSQLLAECDQARKEFGNAIQNVPIEKYSTEFLYPWGDESGNLTTLVQYMVEHDEEHRNEIIGVLGSG